MKVRYGFVSNSSSASFIVKCYDKEGNQLITPEQENVLRSFGFQPTFKNVEHVMLYRDVKEDIDGDQYGYFIVCNEDTVIQVLVDNRIPFEALGHYGHEVILYDGNGTEITIIPNFGNTVLMYGLDALSKYGEVWGEDAWINDPSIVRKVDYSNEDSQTICE